MKQTPLSLSAESAVPASMGLNRRYETPLGLWLCPRCWAAVWSARPNPLRMLVLGLFPWLQASASNIPHILPSPTTRNLKYHNQLEIDIEPSDTVKRIKERVEERQGIPPDQQRCVLLPCLFPPVC